jgi:hypothetical protein
MDEQRKYAILFAATIFTARKLNESGKTPWAIHVAIRASSSTRLTNVGQERKGMKRLKLSVVVQFERNSHLAIGSVTEDAFCASKVVENGWPFGGGAVWNEKLKKQFSN